MTNAPGQVEPPSGPSGVGAAVAEVDTTVDSAAVDGAVAIKGRSPWEIVRRRLRQDRVTMVAFGASVFFVVLAAIAPLLAKVGILNPDQTHPELVQGLGSMPEGFMGGVSASHWLGVEPGTGRDLLSRIITGMTTSLTVALLATIFSVVVGTIIGIISGFAGGRIDWLLSRFMDLVLSFPSTLMLLSLQAVLVDRIASLMGQPSSAPRRRSPSWCSSSASSGSRSSRESFVARFCRCVSVSSSRRLALSELAGAGSTSRSCCRTCGRPCWSTRRWCSRRTSRRKPPLASSVSVSTRPRPPWAPSSTTPWPMPFGSAYFFFPGVTVFLLVLSFNLLGDGLRDALDPKAGRQ